MKVYLVVTYLVVSVACASQKSNTEVIRFAVVCGAGGQRSKKIEEFQNLVEKKDYSSIRIKLFEGSEMEATLSAIVLTEYSSKNVIRLTQEELDRINQIAKSEKKFAFCFTCGLYEEGTLEQLFAKRRLSTMYEIIQRSLFKTL